MPNYQVNVFISHSWSYSDHYEKLSEWIFRGAWLYDQIPIDYRDYSVPKNDPIHNAPTAQALKDAIYQHIASSDVVVIPTGMYANYSDWIQKEIDGADQHKRPILAVDPWGQESASSVVKDAAAECVGWNKNSVVSAIWRLYRK